jgi:hypothetical protein
MSSSPGYGTFSKNPLADPPQIDQDESGWRVVTAFDLYVCAPASSGTLTKRSLSSEKGFQQALIYNGRVGDKISIGYREFSSSTTRPAFNNTVEYDLSSSDIISYRGAKMKIIKADDNTITYQVLSHLQCEIAGIKRRLGPESGVPLQRQSCGTAERRLDKPRTSRTPRTRHRAGVRRPGVRSAPSARSFNVWLICLSQFRGSLHALVRWVCEVRGSYLPPGLDQTASFATERRYLHRRFIRLRFSSAPSGNRPRCVKPPGA